MTSTPLFEASPSVRANKGMQAVGLALAAYVAFNLLLPLAPAFSDTVLALLAFPSTAVFMLLQLWLIRAVVNLRIKPLLSFGLTLLFTAVFAGLVLYLHPNPHWLFIINKAIFDTVPLLMGLSIILACTFFGNLLSRIIREPNVLLPVAVIAMPIDAIGAMMTVGFTHTVVTNHPEIARIVSVPVPSVGSTPHHGALHPIAFVGPGDILFMAFFLAVVLRLNMNVRGTFWWIYGLLTVTMLYVLSPWGINIAALVPMGVAVLIANFKYFKLKREEVFATLYAGGLILVLVTGFYFYAHSRLAHSDAQGDTPDAKPAASKPLAANAPRKASQNAPRPAPGRPAGN